MRSRTNLSSLFHHRWAIPLLGELHKRRGERFAVLAHRFALSRESLSQTLAYLIDLGLVIRNPGYGHPLRPEYLLTARGDRVGAICARLYEQLERDGITELGLRKWPLSIASELARVRTPTRFHQILQTLPGLTPRALSDALKRMENEGWIDREVTDAFPPAVSYALTGKAKSVAPLLAALERRLK